MLQNRKLLRWRTLVVTTVCGRSTRATMMVLDENAGPCCRVANQAIIMYKKRTSIQAISMYKNKTSITSVDGNKLGIRIKRSAQFPIQTPGFQILMLIGFNIGTKALH